MASGDATFSMERLLRGNIAAVEPYSAVLPMEQQEKVGGRTAIKLDANENPYGASPRVLRALSQFTSPHIYPDPAHLQARRALEGYVGLGAEHIVLGNGSDELIDLVLRLFIDPGDKVIDCEPTFGIYAFSTGVFGGRVVVVPRDAGYAVDVDSVIAAVDARTKLLFVASPNNPTGNLTPLEDIRRLLELGIMVVVDEAYYEFSRVTVAPWVSERENLIVLRTFSKWAGLAGLRVGYGLFPRRLADLVYRIKPPYNVNAVAQMAVVESLADVDHLQEAIGWVVAEKRRMADELGRFPFLRVLPSQANFLLCQAAGVDGRRLKEELARRGIFVRYFEGPLLPPSLRISVGRREETDTLVAALKEIGEGL